MIASADATAAPAIYAFISATHARDDRASCQINQARSSNCRHVDARANVLPASPLQKYDRAIQTTNAPKTKNVRLAGRARRSAHNAYAPLTAAAIPAMRAVEPSGPR